MDNDTRILKAKEQIQTKQKAVGKILKFAPDTNCAINLYGTAYNLNTLNTDGLKLMAVMLHSLQTSEETLGLITSISGFTTKQWLIDVQAKLAIVKQKQAIAELKALEAKLDKLLSNDVQTAIELDALLGALNG